MTFEEQATKQYMEGKQDVFGFLGFIKGNEYGCMEEEVTESLQDR